MRRGAAFVVAAGGLLAACTFLVDFEDRPPAVDGGEPVDLDGEPPIQDTYQPPVVVDSGPKVDAADPCFNQPQHKKWGTKSTQRCCRGIARDFETWSDNENCNVCGWGCASGQRCVQTLQGWFFCVGCGNDNALCASTTQCCSNERTGANVFANPGDRNQGVCTASNCASSCGDRCPSPSVCVTDPDTSYYCAYTN